MKPGARVLVVLMNNPRDLQAAREQGWYRIPQARAPKNLAQADYLAFYQTRAFGNEKWSIHHYAPVRGQDTIRRRDLLPDEPDHPRANAPYACVRLGPLETLAEPIIGEKGRRLLFVMTTGLQFITARHVEDLLRKHPIAGDPLYRIIKGQMDANPGLRSLGDPEGPQQLRLLERDDEYDGEYEEEEWWD